MMSFERKHPNITILDEENQLNFVRDVSKIFTKTEWDNDNVSVTTKQKLVNKKNTVHTSSSLTCSFMWLER